MKAFAIALLLLPLGTAVQAKSFAWCQVNGGKYQTYLSGIVEIDDGPEAFRAFKTGAFGTGFRQYVQTLEPKASDVDCNKQESRFFAEDFIGVLISGNPGYRFVRTGWNGNARASAAEHGSLRGSGGRSRKSALSYRR
jgi:hypothetical protein